MLLEISASTEELVAPRKRVEALAPDHLPKKPRALFILHAPSRDLIYGPEEQAYLAAHADFYAPSQTRESILENPGLLADVEVIFSGWGAPIMDEDFLSAAPNLKAVFYGAGSIQYCVSEAFWERGIVITSAYGANAVPVAEYTLATILLSLKNFWRFGAQIKAGKGWLLRSHRKPRRCSAAKPSRTPSARACFRPPGATRARWCFTIPERANWSWSMRPRRTAKSSNC